MKAPQQKRKLEKTVLLIGVFRLIKGAICVALGFGVLTLLDHELAGRIQDWLQQWPVDPDNHYFQSFLSKLTGIDKEHVALLSAGIFFYGGLFTTEGVGLLMRKRWAELLTIITTASFIPLEIYHLVCHFHAMKVAIIIVNMAIVVYLAWRRWMRR